MACWDLVPGGPPGLTEVRTKITRKGSVWERQSQPEVGVNIPGMSLDTYDKVQRKDSSKYSRTICNVSNIPIPLPSHISTPHNPSPTLMILLWVHSMLASRNGYFKCHRARPLSLTLEEKLHCSRLSWTASPQMVTRRLISLCAALGLIYLSKDFPSCFLHVCPLSSLPTSPDLINQGSQAGKNKQQHIFT